MVLEQINQIFGEIFDEPGLSINENTTPADIPDWDSVAQVKLILAIEEQFNIRFAGDELSAFRSVGDVIRSVSEKTGLC